MFLFLRPRYIKQGKLYIKEAWKRLHYHRDKWSDATIADFEGEIKNLKQALKAHDRAGVEKAERAIEGLCGQHCPAGKDAWIAENVEVFLVAIIVALGIRTYILQPFTIPTASMQPTLFGITGRSTEEEPPNILKRCWDFALSGRTWHNVVAQTDERIDRIEDVKRGGVRRIFTYTRITTDKGNEYWVNEHVDAVIKTFGLQRGFPYAKGQPIVRGFTDTGDHVFVDKISYHFRKPRRGEVFVFDTRTLPTNERLRNPDANTQYYIKRLVALGGDVLQVRPPQLWINGSKAEGTGYERVMQGTLTSPVDGYRGYSNRSLMGQPFPRLGHPDDTFTIPDRDFFAMGDNSYESSDGRDWGPVPPQNLMGTGFFVYWPFTRDRDPVTNRGSRFGLIH